MDIHRSNFYSARLNGNKDRNKYGSIVSNSDHNVLPKTIIGGGTLSSTRSGSVKYFLVVIIVCKVLSGKNPVFIAFGLSDYFR